MNCNHVENEVWITSIDPVRTEENVPFKLTFAPSIIKAQRQSLWMTWSDLCCVTRLRCSKNTKISMKQIVESKAFLKGSGGTLKM